MDYKTIIILIYTFIFGMNLKSQSPFFWCDSLSNVNLIELLKVNDYDTIEVKSKQLRNLYSLSSKDSVFADRNRYHDYVKHNKIWNGRKNLYKSHSAYFEIDSTIFYEVLKVDSFHKEMFITFEYSLNLDSVYSQVLLINIDQNTDMFGEVTQWLSVDTPKNRTV